MEAWWTYLAVLVLAIVSITTTPFLFLWLTPPIGGVHLIPGFTLGILGSATAALLIKASNGRGWRKLKPSGIPWDVEKYAEEAKARNERTTMKENQVRRQPAK